MARQKKPVLAILQAVKITRDGEYANIEYKDPAIAGVSLKIGPDIAAMTDQEILDLHNHIIGERGNMAAGQGRETLSCQGAGRSALAYETVEEAFFFVSGDQPYMHTAVVNLVTGEAFYASEMAGTDDIPEEAEDNDDYLWIPHKHDLDLGKPLVMDFVLSRCPDLYEQVTGIFRRKGAYGRFKYLLDRKGLLEEWYAFEREKIREALVRWCGENGVELE